MDIDWNQAAPPAPDQVPDLGRAQFEWLMATQTPQGRYLGDIMNAIVDALKPVDPELYRLLVSRRAGIVFNFAETMALVTQFGAQLAAAYPDEDFSEAAILAVWNGALAQS